MLIIQSIIGSDPLTPFYRTESFARELQLCLSSLLARAVCVRLRGGRTSYHNGYNARSPKGTIQNCGHPAGGPQPVLVHVLVGCEHKGYSSAKCDRGPTRLVHFTTQLGFGSFVIDLYNDQDVRCIRYTGFVLSLSSFLIAHRH